MTRRVFEVEARGMITVTFDDSLLPDDEWRKVFYDITTLEQLAEFFAWNIGIQGSSGNMLDGFCDTPLAAEVRAVDDGDWEFEATEIIEKGAERF
jgi:hypothetical protein